MLKVLLTLHFADEEIEIQEESHAVSEWWGQSFSFHPHALNHINMMDSPCPKKPVPPSW